MARNILKKYSGFSLMEVLVTIGIFAILSIIISGIFINIDALQQETNSRQRLQNEGRYILEKIAREVRGREIDYGAYLPEQISAEGLTDRLLFKEDEYKDTMSIIFDSSSNQLKLAKTNPLGEAILNASDIVVSDVKFRLDPPQNSSATVQPRVTVLLVLRNNPGLVRQRFVRTINVQTTISSKVYK